MCFARLPQLVDRYFIEVANAAVHPERFSDWQICSNDLNSNVQAQDGVSIKLQIESSVHVCAFKYVASQYPLYIYPCVKEFASV